MPQKEKSDRKNTYRSKAAYFLLFLPLFFLSLPIWAQETLEQDQFLQILQRQVNANYFALKQKNSNLSYLSYRVDEELRYQVSATFGNVDAEQESKLRRLTIHLRVGDAENQTAAPREVLLPVENGEEAIAQILRKETDAAYTVALQRYEEARLQTFFVSPSHSEKSFISYAAQSHYEAPLNVTVDGDKWKRKLRSYSLNFKPSESILKGTASLDFSYVRKYFVSSEGATIVQNALCSFLNIHILGFADDGMMLPLEKSWFSFYLEELPSDDAILAETVRLRDQFLLLQNAPRMELETAPALLGSDVVAAWTLANLIPNIVACEVSDYKKFDAIPQEINITADPTSKYFGNLPLCGSYIYDDEGVMTEKVELVQNGVLQTSLLTRYVESEQMTNAHARSQAGLPPAARPSNLLFYTTSPVSYKDLRDRLLQEMKSRNKPYGYCLQRASRQVAEGDSRFFALSPMLVYKVFADGTPDQLVRGAEWCGELFATLQNIVAVGESSPYQAFRCNGVSGTVPVSISAPPILLSELTLQTQIFEPQSVLQTRPYQDIDGMVDFDEMVFKAMQEELRRSRLNLSTSGLPSPQRMAYLVTDAKSFGAKASLGAMIYTCDKPQRGVFSEVVIGNREWNTHNCSTLPAADNEEALLAVPLDNNYSAVRSALWHSSENAYQEANHLWSQKNRFYWDDGILQKPQTDKEMSLITPNLQSFENEFQPVNQFVLESVTRELSKAFAAYPSLTGSYVESYAIEAEVLSLSSDGVQYKQPQQLVCVRAYAETVANDGELLSDACHFYFHSTSELSAQNEMENHLRAMAENLVQLRSAPLIDAPYNGPVLFGPEAVSDLFAYNFLKDNELIFARRQFFMQNDSLLLWENSFESESKGQRYFSKDFSLITSDSLQNYDNQSVIGGFVIDADGVVPAEEIEIIKRGKLQRLLSNRLRTATSKESSGHQRLAFNGNFYQPSLAPGVLVMETKGKAARQLRAQAKSLAKRAGYNYYYLVAKFKENSLEPLLLYRVNIKDKSAELVRAAAVSLPQINDYKKNMSFSSKKKVYNQMFIPYDFTEKEHTLINGVPCSFILPDSFLFSDGAVYKRRFSPLQPQFLQKKK